MARKQKSKIRTILIGFLQIIKEIITFLFNLIIGTLNLIGIAAE